MRIGDNVSAYYLFALKHGGLYATGIVGSLAGVVVDEFRGGSHYLGWPLSFLGPYEYQYDDTERERVWLTLSVLYA